MLSVIFQIPFKILHTMLRIYLLANAFRNTAGTIRSEHIDSLVPFDVPFGAKHSFEFHSL